MANLEQRAVAQNKKAWHDYFVEEAFEAGIELCGTEVKSVRLGKINLKDAWCDIDSGEMFVNGMHISPYEKGNIFNKDPLRRRRILIHKREILRLYGIAKQQGLTLVPLKVYFKGPFVKLEIGLCKGKKQYDKRDDMARRDAKRETDRVMKEQNR
jgi:SsrA-binding protein